MPIPTQKEIAARKRTQKARMVNIASREAKRLREGREPDNDVTRAARKKANKLHAGAHSKTRTVAEKAARTAKAEIDKLNKNIKGLSVIDPDTLLRTLVSHVDEKKSYNLLKALELREEGVSQAEIARQVDCSVTKVKSMFVKYDKALHKVLSYKGHRADILADLQRRILLSISDLDIKQSTMVARVQALCNLYDKERVERNLSTANIVTIHDDVAAIRAAQQQRNVAVVVPLSLTEEAKPGKA